MFPNDTEKGMNEDSRLLGKLTIEQIKEILFGKVEMPQQQENTAETDKDTKELKAEIHVLKTDLTETVRLLRKIKSIGVVYAKPDDWNSFKEGGPPSFEDCEAIDLSDLVDFVLDNPRLRGIE